MLVAKGEQLGNADIEIRKEYFLFSPDNVCQQGWKNLLCHLRMEESEVQPLLCKMQRAVALQCHFILTR